MKTVLYLTVFIAFYVLVALAEEYTNKYDNIDLDEILSNERLIQNYADCILDKGNCTPDGEELKSHIKEALDNGCAKCSEKHKAGAKRVITFLSKNKPAIWKEAQDKYDPDGNYRKKYSDLIEKEGVN